KVRGPLMDTCNACGERYWPEDREDHLANNCFPPKIHLNKPIKPQSAKPSAGEKWRTMKSSSLTPAERKTLGLFPRGKRFPRNKRK
ncbi:MAG TPA: hypothetical protein VFC17_04095, partial [Candidatus Limnocylindrales bacterium]|nr:hypothetical protein [Candidatus Limnocylindrales bacterium]